MNVRSVFIVGATSAIAMACARRWVTADTRFFLVARNSEKLEQVADDLRVRGGQVTTHVLDVNDFAGHGAMLERCCAALGQIDVALIAHGSLPDQAACEQDPTLAVAEFTTNALSAIAIMIGLAPRMEAQAHGCIAVISSVAGDRGRASNYLYGSAKSAVSRFCEGLRGRLHTSGVRVLTIKPGFVDTPMTQGLALPGALVATPERVGQDIVRAIDKGRDTLYTPWFWRAIMLIIVHVPGIVLKRMKL